MGDGRRAHDIVHNVRNAIKKGSAISSGDKFERGGEGSGIYSSAGQKKPARSRYRPHSELPAIEGDPTQIQQVLINLVHNAVDEMDFTARPAAG